MKKRILPLLLAIALVVGMLPAAALAEGSAPSISEVSMTLTGILSVNFKVDPGSEGDMSTYTLNATVGDDTNAQVITDPTVDDAGLYVYTVSVPAHRLLETVTVELMDGETEVDTLEWVVAAYVAGLKEQEPDNAAQSDLLDALVNYAAYAAAYADGTVGAVDVVEAVNRTAFESNKMVINTVDPSLGLVASLYLDDACDLRFKFNTAAFDGCTLLVNDEAVDASALTTEGSKYVYAIAEILPQNYDEMYNIKILNGEQTLADVDYSVLSYAYSALGRDQEAQTGLNGLLKSMYLYGVAADAYIKAQPVEPAEDALTFEYRYGAANLIQVNTNLPATTPCANFLATNNGCNIDQSVNEYQQFGWASMANVDGTIVLTFNFSSNFTAGQTYKLPAGAVFGFTDGNTYTLDKNYTFTFDGSGWTMEATESAPVETTIDLTYRYGAEKLIQFNTDLPATTPCANFLATDNGCNLIQTGDQQVGYISMLDADGTIVLTFNFNNAFEVGQSYTLSADSVFGFTNGNSYTLENDITLYWDGSAWSTTAPVIPEPPQESGIDLAYRWGTNNLIQINTNLAATTPLVSFLAADNGCNLIQSGDQAVGWIGMDNAGGTVVLSFHFNSAFTAGQSYSLSAGSVFGFTDGNTYTLNSDCTFTFDGANWSLTVIESPVNLTYRWGAANLIQYNTDLPATTPIANFLAGDNGCNLIQSGDQTVGWISMANADGTIVLTFNFNGAFTVGQSYTLEAGSVFGFTDGNTYTLDSDIILYWDGNNWSTTAPVPETDVLDESNFTGGKDIITFADLPVNSLDADKIEEYKGLGFNTSLLTEDHTGTQGPDENYRVTMATANEPQNGLNFAYRWGTANLIQVNTNLPATTPIANFTAGENGCNIDQSGNQYQQVGWIGMVNADGTIVLTFNFNSAFSAGQTYVLPKGAVFGFTDGNQYTLDADYTFTFDGTNWSMNAATLNLSLSAGAAKYIQLKTNIPTGLTYGDFQLGDTAKGHNVILETTEGAQTVAWFSYSELSGAVYLTFNFNGYNKPGTQYILKAGTALKAGDNVYTTDRDYILTVHNDYLTSLENLDKAGLKVWIRNHHNKADYFTDALTAALKLYDNIIDGFYMVDEAFQTNALLNAAGQAGESSDFESMVVARDWFNQNFADKYYHSNQVPVTSYDHYNAANGSSLSAMDADAYRAFLQAYKQTYNDQLTNASGASVSFDNYPFVRAQGTYRYGTLNLQSRFESGIQSTYLLNSLIAAQVAAEDDFGVCIQTFEATDLTYDGSRDITSSAEISLQLYTGMAMGADLFEYFAYNSNGEIEGILNLDGSQRIYGLVKEGNEALCFADVVNTFTWNGIVTSAGSANHHNGDAFTYVENMVLTNISNGTLESYASTDDAVIGCFAKGDLSGYMVVNYNDPNAVTGNNTVNLTFADCTRARIYTCVDGQLISEVVELTNGSCTVTLAPGSGCFVIPA